MGTIWQRSDGIWVAQITLEGKPRSFYSNRRTDVQGRLRAAQQSVDKGLPVETQQRQTVAQYLSDWLEITKESIRPGTWRRYGAVRARARAAGDREHMAAPARA